MGVLSPGALKLRNLNVLVASDTIENTNGVTNSIVVDAATLNNPFAITIDIYNPNTGGHDEDATFDIRRGNAYDQSRIFRVANMVTSTANQRWTISAAVGSGQLDGGTGTISYCVPQLAYWQADAALNFRFVWAGTPTSGSLIYYVTCHY